MNEQRSLLIHFLISLPVGLLVFPLGAEFLVVYFLVLGLLVVGYLDSGVVPDQLEPLAYFLSRE